MRVYMRAYTHTLQERERERRLYIYVVYLYILNGEDRYSELDIGEKDHARDVH